MRDAGTFPRRPAGRGAVGEKWVADLTLGAVLLFLVNVS